mgnify:CR=1 FL=1
MKAPDRLTVGNWVTLNGQRLMVMYVHYKTKRAAAYPVEKCRDIAKKAGTWDHEKHAHPFADFLVE